jgi:hypothetical protein
MSDLNQSKGGINSKQERLLRTATFEALMDHWGRLDDRHRRTWLAWFVGQLSAESLNAMAIRLNKKAELYHTSKEIK